MCSGLETLSAQHQLSTAECVLDWKHSVFNINLAQLRRYSIVTRSFQALSSSLHTMLAGLVSTCAHIQHS